MYNRYVPSADGTYQRKVMPSPQRSAPPPHREESPPPQPPRTESAPTTKQPKPLFQLNLDTGDVLVLLILLLVMTEGQETDTLSILITLAAFLLMQ